MIVAKTTTTPNNIFSIRRVYFNHEILFYVTDTFPYGIFEDVKFLRTNVYHAIFVLYIKEQEKWTGEFLYREADNSTW